MYLVIITGILIIIGLISEVINPIIGVKITAISTLFFVTACIYNISQLLTGLKASSYYPLFIVPLAIAFLFSIVLVINSLYL